MNFDGKPFLLLLDIIRLLIKVNLYKQWVYVECRRFVSIDDEIIDCVIEVTQFYESRTTAHLGLGL